MKLYIATQSKIIGQLIGLSLYNVGHKITSSWLFDDTYAKPKTPIEYSCAVHKCEDDIRSSDALVFLATYDDIGKGSKFVEMGMALALDKPVYILGTADFAFAWHEIVKVFDDITALIEFLKEYESPPSVNNSAPNICHWT